METKINVAEILKDKPQETKLYDLLYNIDVELDAISTTDTETVVWCTNKDKNNIACHLSYSEFGTVRGHSDGLRILLPSKEMRDWSKFAWKKGDVLVTEGGAAHIIFEKFTDDTYTIFAGKYYYCKNGKKGYTYLRECDNAITEEFTLETEDAAKTFIGFIEKRLGGKLNRETLEVEKPKKPVFELGKLYVFNEQDEDGELTIIGKLIGKNESYDTLTFGNQYEIENEKFVTDQAFDLHISVHEELREATEGEAITFQEADTNWKKSKEQPSFKPFDKVLVRDSKSDNWRANLFGYIGKDGYYRCVFANWVYCIPYAGNEHLLGTTKDVED